LYFITHNSHIILQYTKNKRDHQTFKDLFSTYFQTVHLHSHPHHPKDTKKIPYTQAFHMTMCHSRVKTYEQPYQHSPKVINMTLCHPRYEVESSSPKMGVICEHDNLSY